MAGYNATVRVLHIANFSWFTSRGKRLDDWARYYSIDRKISHGLIRNGHSVWDFSYRDTARFLSPLGLGKRGGKSRMHRHLLDLARRLSPDWILLGHCELLSGEVLASVRKILPNARIAQWWVDPFADSSLPSIREKLSCLDAFFATTAPDFVRGRLGDCATPLYFMPNIVDSSVETGCAFAASSIRYDLFFAGAEASERQSLLRMVTSDSRLRGGFFGFGGREKIGGAAMVAALGESRMGLNLSRASDIPLYSSDRLAQITGNGALALTPRTPGMTALYAEDEVAYFEDERELRGLIDRYLKDDDEWRLVAERGHRRAHQSYNERRVARFLEEATFGIPFSENYEWSAPSSNS